MNVAYFSYHYIITRARPTPYEVAFIIMILISFIFISVHSNI